MNNMRLSYVSSNEYNSCCNKSQDKCENLCRQSPLDIKPTGIELKIDNSLLDIKWKSEDINFVKIKEKNNNYSWYVDSYYTGNKTLIYNNNTFELLEFHFNKPSEHQLNGKVYDMEVHFVHRSITNKNEYLVLGFFISDGLFATTEQGTLDDAINMNQSVTINMKNENTSTYYSYPGSLTTDPYDATTASWIIFDTEILSKDTSVWPKDIGIARQVKKTVNNSEIIKFIQLYSPNDITLLNNSTRSVDTNEYISIDENVNIGYLVGELDSSSKSSTNFTYILKNHTDMFYIEDNQLLTNNVLNYEKNSSYTLKIMVLDDNNLSYEKDFTININKVDVTIELSNTEVNENEKIGYVIGYLNTNSSYSNNFTYVLQDYNDKFTILNNELLTNIEFNYEIQNKYNIKISSIDDNNSVYEQNFTINILNINETPTFITLSNNKIEENSTIGSVIGTLTARDYDKNSTFTYTLNNNNDIFDISSNQLITKKSLDYEVQNEYTLNITVTDQGGLAYSRDFIIEILNVNERPTNIELSNTSVYENVEIGYVIGELESSDPDKNSNFTYTMDNYNDTFIILNNQLIVKNKLDYERQTSYTFNITTKDMLDLTYTKEFTIEILNINERPTNIELSNNLVYENDKIGIIVGTFTTDDPDNNATFKYTLNNNNDNFSISNNQLLTTQSFDYEIQNEYILNITVTDEGGLSYTKDFTIKIKNINENPTHIELYNSSFYENIEIGYVVSNLNTVDPDKTRLFTYILNNYNDKFIISNNQLITKDNFDYEIQNEYILNITVTDQGGLTYTKDLTITVLNVNERPTNIKLSNNIIEENVKIGYNIGTLTTNDEDISSSFTYILNNFNDKFGISKNILITKDIIDYEVQKEYILNITTVDEGGLSYTKDFTLTITNINERPTDIILSDTSVYENSSVGHIIGNISTVDEDLNSTFTYILNSYTDKFSIYNNQLIVINNLDYEIQNEYILNIVTVDEKGLTYSKNFTITVMNINERPLDILLSDTSFYESVEIGYIIGDLNTVDPDEKETFTYTLVSYTDKFTLNGNKLITKDYFNYEEKNEYVLTIKSIDSKGLSITKDAIINVLDTNEAPTNIILSNKMFKENENPGYLVGNFFTVDPDKDLSSLNIQEKINSDDRNRHIYVLNNNHDKFVILLNRLITRNTFDYEVQNLYTISVTSIDQGGLQYTKDFNIQILNTDDAPTDIYLSNTSVKENVEIGYVIGTLTCKDEDENDIFIYTLNNYNDIFSISENNELTANSILNYEENNQYTIHITVTDSGGLTYSKDFVINILDVDEVPTNISISSNTFYENVEVGYKIGDLTTVDEDNNETFTYKLNNYTDMFIINNNSVLTNKEFDYETQNQYIINITVTDSGGLTYSEDITLNILNINESPININLSNTTFYENSEIGHVIGQLSASDPDANSTFTYILNTNNDIFNINTTDLITTSNFNYETENQYIINISVVDQGGLIHSKDFTINVLNINEKPTQITLSNNTINENVEIGTEVGILTTSDNDINETFTYSIDTNYTDKFIVSGNKVLVNGLLDYETQNQYIINITVTDSGGLMYSQDFFIQVLNIVEAPLDIQLSNTMINENIQTGYIIGTLTAIDQDVNSTFTYTLNNDSNGNFTINDNKLLSNAVYDYETQNQYTINIKVTNQSGLSYSKDFIINIININELSTDITISNNSINENEQKGSTIGELNTSDVDINSTFTYKLYGLDKDKFYVNNNLLVSNMVFDYETKNTYDLTISSNDGLNTYIKDFTIYILNINEAPINITLSNNIVNENVEIGTLIGDLSAVDYDANESFSYILNNYNDKFAIDDNKLLTNGELDYENQNSYILNITVTDSGNLTFTKDLTINIEDVNEPPTDILLSNNLINENMDIGSVIGNLSASDQDNNDSFNYTLNTNRDKFKLSNNQLLTNGDLDYESQNTYTLNITVKDKKGLSFTKDLIINIENVNEPPTDILLSNNSIVETASIGSVIGNLTTSDQDSNDSFTYTLNNNNDTFIINNNQLLTNGDLDYESQNTYTLNITVTDSGNLTFTKDLTINIENVNEPPTDILLSNNSIEETAPTGSFIGNLSTSDQDSNDSFTYTLNNNNNTFLINNNQLLTNGNIDYESQNTYTLNITVTDSANLSFTKDLMINIEDVRNGPINY